MSIKQEMDQIRSHDAPVELMLSNRYLREINFQDNKLKDIQSKEVSGKAIRMIHEGRIGSAPGGLQTSADWLLTTAAKLAAFGRKASFELPERDGKMVEITNSDPNLKTVDLGAARQLAETIIERLGKELPEWSVGGGITVGEAINRLVSSRGVDFRFQERAAGFYINITLPREGDLLELYTGRSFFPDETTMDAVIEDVVWRAKNAETVADMPEGEYPLLLHPEALASFLSAFKQAVKGRAVFEGLSPLKGKIGEKIFNPAISILDDPTDKQLAGYTPLGDEGVVGKPVKLVENGVLKSYLTDLEFSAKLDQPHTGHGSRFPGTLDESIPRGDASITDTSWIMPAGDSNLADMMGSIKDGVYLVATWDVWSGNLIGGDVSGSTHLAYRIKDGKPVGRIKDMRVSGNLYKLLGEKLQAISLERPVTGSGSLRVPYYLIDPVKLA